MRIEAADEQMGRMNRKLDVVVKMVMGMLGSQGRQQPPNYQACVDMGFICLYGQVWVTGCGSRLKVVGVDMWMCGCFCVAGTDGIESSPSC